MGGLERLPDSLWWFVACMAHGPSPGHSGDMESSTDTTSPALSLFLRGYARSSGRASHEILLSKTCRGQSSSGLLPSLNYSVPESRPGTNVPGAQRGRRASRPEASARCREMRSVGKERKRVKKILHPGHMASRILLPSVVLSAVDWPYAALSRLPHHPCDEIFFFSSPPVY